MGLLFVYIGVMAAFSQGYLVGRVVERWGETRVMIGGLAGTSAGLLVVGLSHDLWVLLVGLAALAIASGFVFATTTALISLAAGDRDQGAILGLNASISRRGPHRRADRRDAPVPARRHRGPAPRGRRAVRALRRRRDPRRRPPGARVLSFRPGASGGVERRDRRDV